MNLSLLADFLKRHAAFWLLSVVYLAVRWQYLEAPMERDEGTYTYFGQLVLDGKTPYIDFYEHRLPGIFYVYALMVLLFGSFKGMALGVMVLNVFSLGFLYALGRGFWGKAAGIWTAAAAAVWMLAPEISGYTRQSEHMVVFFMTWGLWLLWRALQKDSIWRFAAAGVLLCWAMLTKPNGVFFIVSGGLWLVFWYFFKKQYKKLFLYGLVYSAAVFAAFGALLLMVVKDGTWEQMRYWSFTFAADYSTSMPLEVGLKYFYHYWGQVFEYYWWSIGLAAAGLLSVFFLKKSEPSSDENQRPDKAFRITALWSFALLSFLTITPGFRFYGHYWLMWMPSLAFAVGGLCALLSERLPAAWGKWALHGGLFLAFAAHGAQRSEYYTKPNWMKISRRVYSTNPFPESLVIGKHLQKKARPGDQLAIIGSETELYIYTGMRSFSRHANFIYMLMDTSKTDALTWQEEWKADFEAQKPRFLVAYQHGMSLSVQPGAKLSIMDWVATKINTEYKRIGIVDDLGTVAPKYMWEERSDSSFATYAPKGTYNAQIFERKPPTE